MEEQVLTIDVVPQTVTEVIYLNPQDINFEKTVEVESYYSSSSEHENENETYEIGCVDATQVEDMPLVYDQSESFVMLPEVYQIQQERSEKQDRNNLVSDEEYNTPIPAKRKKITCHVCKMKFTSRNKLFQHRVLHKSNLEKPIKSNGKLQYVLSTTKEVYVCKVCGEKFERTQALSIHFRKYHQTTPISVPSQFLKQHLDSTKYHEKNCEVGQTFFCNICGCPCSTEMNLYFHYKKHEPLMYTCDLCEAGYNDENDFLNHKKTHNMQFLYACNKCDESFPTTALVSHHIRQVHGKNNQKVASLPIKQEPEESTNIELIEYLNTTNASEIDPSTSQVESATFSDDSQNRKRRFNCNICNLKFRSQGALTRHKTQHMLDTNVVDDNLT